MMRDGVSRRAFRWTAALGLIAAIGATGLEAQYRELPAPPAYALENVTVWTANGMRAGMTVVVRDGRIVTMAEGAEVPADATVLEGEGWPSATIWPIGST